MKIEIPLFESLLLIGASLAARIQTQGVEQALAVTAIEYGMNSIQIVKRLFADAWRLVCDN